MKKENENVNPETAETKTDAAADGATVTAIAVLAADAAEVDKAIRGSVYAAMGIGIVPFPLINFAAVTASSLNMVRKLSRLYGVEFKEGIAKKILAAVVGAGVGTLATPLVESVVGLVPIIGLPLVIGTRPVLNGATTYALGRMFVTHFERGGSFVGANIDAMKNDFADAFKNSREWLGDAIKGKEKAAEATGA
jgi:uncharacterized protein (DUF697 family)